MAFVAEDLLGEHLVKAFCALGDLAARMPFDEQHVFTRAEAEHAILAAQVLQQEQAQLLQDEVALGQTHAILQRGDPVGGHEYQAGDALRTARVGVGKYLVQGHAAVVQRSLWRVRDGRAPLIGGLEHGAHALAAAGFVHAGLEQCPHRLAPAFARGEIEHHRRVGVLARDLGDGLLDPAAFVLGDRVEQIEAVRVGDVRQPQQPGERRARVHDTAVDEARPGVLALAEKHVQPALRVHQALAEIVACQAAVADLHRLRDAPIQRRRVVERTQIPGAFGHGLYRIETRLGRDEQQYRGVAGEIAQQRQRPAGAVCFGRADEAVERDRAHLLGRDDVGRIAGMDQFAIMRLRR